MANPWLESYNPNAYSPPQATTPTQTAQPKVGGAKRLLAELLPFAGGVVGGVAGTVAGPLGTVAGGALGSAGGEALRESLLGENLSAKNIGVQGALGAIPGIGKTATTAVKAARAGEPIAAKLFGRAVGAAGEQAATETAAPVASKVGTFLEDKGLQTKARAGGYGVGEKVAGKPSLGYFDSANIDKTLAEQGIKPGSPTGRLKQVELKLQSTGKNIDNLVKQNNVDLPLGSQGQIISDYLQAIEGQPGMTPAVARSAKLFATNFANQAKDAKSLINFRRGLDKQVINFSRNPDSKMAADQLAARTFRDILTEHTNNLVPGIQDANKAYHGLTQASEFLKGGAKQISDQSQSAGGGLVGRLLTNETAQAAKSYAGAGAQAVGKKVSERAAAQQTGSLADQALARVTSPTQLAKGTIAQGTGRYVFGGLAGGQPPEGQTPPPVDQTAPTDTGTPSGIAPQSSGSVYGEQNLIADIQRDPKHLNDYLTLYKTLNAGTASTGSKTGKPTAQQAGLAQSGLGSLNQLRQFIQENPGIVGQTAVPGQNAPVIGGLVRNLAGTGDYQAAAQNTIDAIARARTGAAMTKQEEAFYQRMLPQPGDSQDTVQFKLQQLQTALEPFVPGSSSGGNNYADNTALLQALGAQ